MLSASQSGMESKRLSLGIGRPESEAKRLIEKHQQTYPRFWAWADRVVAHIQLEGVISTAAGWQVKRQAVALNGHQKRSLGKLSYSVNWRRYAEKDMLFSNGKGN